MKNYLEEIGKDILYSFRNINIKGKVHPEDIIVLSICALNMTPNFKKMNTSKSKIRD